jgi:hypothetical protein
MKLGVSYNLFDGEELIESSIKCIRNDVDFISVIYQTTSNFGNTCSESLVPLLNNLKEKGMIDEMVKYNPSIKNGGHYNEITKRNLGLYLSENAGCTHHMAMDSDEFYTEEQFKYLKKIMIDGDYDSSACQMVTYYKNPIYRLEPKEEYYVPLIYKIRNNIEYVFAHQFPVLVDPTRRMNPEKCKIFTRDEIEMHHMSYIRKNLRMKLNNSSAKSNFKSIDKIVNYYDKWEYPQKALLGGIPDKYYEIVKVEKLFNI